MVSSLPEPPSSTLPSSRSERFLSQVLEFALTSDWRTPKDYFDHFGTRTVVEKLEHEPPLRTRLLVETTGVHERLAQRKSPESATEDLDIALEQGLTTAQQLMALIPNEDRVRHLDPKELWRFLMGAGSGGDSAESDAITVERVTFLLRAALDCGVLTLRDIAHSIGLRRVSTCLPQAELQRVVEDSLSRAQQGHRLSEDELLSTIPLDSLVKYVPLAHTWSTVVEGPLLTRAGLREGDSGAPVAARKGGRPGADSAATEGGKAESNQAEMRRVCEALGALGRLPSDSHRLGLPVLLSIESMYAELQQTHEELRRRVVIREAFPNEGLLRLGVTALLHMLDPNLSREALESASTESLADTLLHEEQQITDAHQASGLDPGTGQSTQ